MRYLGRVIAAAAGLAMLAAPALGQTTLRLVAHSDLKILDPIWTTAYITRNHGYMIYDTLFAMDAKLEIQPQMVDNYEVTADKLTWTFTLRDGLKWHDGTAGHRRGLRRLAQALGRARRAGPAADELRRRDEGRSTPRPSRIVLKEPFGLVLEALGKPVVDVPFIMPKRVAETDPNKQIDDYTGSGPFIFKKDEWKPGEKVVYVKNPDYKPRAEPPSRLAGGKVAKVDRVEWIAIPDPQTAVNALLAGEIDMHRGAAARPAARC